MSTVEPPSSTPPPPPVATTPIPSRPRNGLGVATLVIGVASLVAVFSFILFPIGLVSSIVGLFLGAIASSRARAQLATNRGQAVAGMICCLVALIAAITLSVKVGTWAARNTGTFARFNKCVAQAGDRAEVATCISRFANEVRP
jgi:uncharacterized membrane protein